EKKFSKLYSLLFDTKYNYSSLRYLDSDFKNKQGFLENNYWQHEQYVSISNLFVLSNQIKSSLSIDYIRNTLDADLKEFAYPTRNTLLLNVAFDWTYKDLTLQANGLATLWNERVKV